MIICAAIRIVDSFTGDNFVVCGLRHGDCFKVISRLDKKWRAGEKVQGFINHKGEFLNRKEALKHAEDCGQIPETVRYYREDHNINELYSEDLY